MSSVDDNRGVCGWIGFGKVGLYEFILILVILEGSGHVIDTGGHGSITFQVLWMCMYKNRTFFPAV